MLEYSGKVALALLTLAIGWWLINTLTGRVGGLLARRGVDRTLQGFVGNLVSIVLKILLVVSVASMIGIQTATSSPPSAPPAWPSAWPCRATWLTSLRRRLADPVRPFKVGDWIEAQGVAGTVVTVVLIFHTVLRSGDNKRIIVPSRALSNGTVTNYRQPLRKVIFDVGIDYDADPEMRRTFSWPWPTTRGF